MVTRSSGVLSRTKSDPLEQFLAGQLSERTRKAYKADLRDFFRFAGFQEINIASARAISFEDVVAFRNHLSENGYKRASINRKLSSLKALFKMLVSAGLIEANPADSALVRGYKLDETMTGKALATQALTQMERAILEEPNELRGMRDMAIFQLLTYAGLRRSEVVGITWEAIGQEGVFHVLILKETKSGSSQEVKLQPVVIHHLYQYREILQQCGYPIQGSVFISLAPNNSHGHPLTDQSINLIVKKYAAKAGIPQNVTAHMFRHTCCTLAIEGGAKPQQVQSHLRHKDLKTTMRYYENREKLTDNASDYINF